MEPKPAVNCEHLKKLVREVPDFPKKGILFYDITTLLKDKIGFATLIDSLSEHYLDRDIDLVLGIEARGFIFGPPHVHFEVVLDMLGRTGDFPGVAPPSQRDV